MGVVLEANSMKGRLILGIEIETNPKLTKKPTKIWVRAGHFLNPS